VRSRAASLARKPRRAGDAPPDGTRPRRRISPELAPRRAFTFIAPWGFEFAPRLARVLDSLVRVSRRVGRGADSNAADPGRPAGARPARGAAAVDAHCSRSPRQSKNRPARASPVPREGGTGAASVRALASVVRGGPSARGACNSRRRRAKRRPPSHLATAACDRPTTGRGARPSGKCARAGRDARGRVPVAG